MALRKYTKHPYQMLLSDDLGVPDRYFSKVLGKMFLKDMYDPVEALLAHPVSKGRNHEHFFNLP